MGSAIISECGRYRYWLSRQVEGGDKYGPPVVFIMLNPSTADAETDDPTIRRCLGFARRFTASELIVVNLFAYRSTDPKLLPIGAEAVGPENEDHLRRALDRAHYGGGLTVCAWGAHKRARVQAVRLLQIAGRRPLRALGITAAGDPRHPLYLPANAPLIAWPQ